MHARSLLPYLGLLFYIYIYVSVYTYYNVLFSNKHTTYARDLPHTILIYGVSFSLNFPELLKSTEHLEHYEHSLLFNHLQTPKNEHYKIENNISVFQGLNPIFPLFVLIHARTLPMFVILLPKSLLCVNVTKLDITFVLWYSVRIIRNPTHPAPRAPRGVSRRLTMCKHSDRAALAALVTEALASGTARYLRAPDPGRARAPSPNSAACRDATLRGVSHKPNVPKRTFITYGHRVLPVPTYRMFNEE